MFHVKDEQGQSLTEYALILSIVALGVIVALELFGGGVINLFQNIKVDVESVM